MKATYLVLLLSLGFFSIAARADNRNKDTRPQQTPSAAKLTPCAPGVVYVKMKAGSTIGRTMDSKGNVTFSIGPSSAFDRVTSALGLTQTVAFDSHASKDSISRAFGIDRIYCLYYTNRAIDPHAAVAMLMATGEVECGSVRYLFPVSKTTNDPLLGDEYGLTKMNVFNAWNTTTGDTSIVIADVDCAINIDHEDLKNQIKFNWGEIGSDSIGKNKEKNGVDDDSDGYIDNYEGWDMCGDVNVGAGAALKPNNNPRPRETAASHGTHTAGCILAQGNNSLGIAGVAYGCRLLPIKAAGSDNDNIGAGYEGIHYANTHGARIINCSWGGFETAADTSFSNVFLYEAIARGILIVAAAGNSGSTNDGTFEYPGDGPSVLSVGATDQGDAAASFSDFGNSVSVWAPGVTIVSCDYPGNSAYSAEDGTSFSCPLTAGVAGLLLSEHPDWLPKFVAKQIIATCDNVVNPNDRTEFWGRINAGNALSVPVVGPGLVITGYSLDNVASDSLGMNHTYDFKVTFKNVLGAGSNLSAVPISELGVQLSSSAVSLGSIAPSATATGDFQITRNGVFSQGNLPVQFAVTNGNSYNDTLSLYLPLTVQPGFVLDQAGLNATSIFRVSNTSAWAAFGLASTTGTVINAQFAHEQGSVWSGLGSVGDGTNPPYYVTALDSNIAYFGSGPGASGTTTGGTPTVTHTANGGRTFDTVSVKSFAAFVNTIHFFDAKNGILIGDPVANKWGIGTTSDGGQSWHPLAKTVVASGSIASWNNSASWVGNYGWFGTNSRQILRTTNRGLTWVSVKTDTNQNSLSVAFDDDAKHGFACYQSISGNGSNGVTVSSDSGASWQQLTTLPVASMTPAAIQFIPHSDTAILTSNMGIYRTTDFGLSWSPIGIPVLYLGTSGDLSISRGQGEFVVTINAENIGVASYREALPDDTTATDTTADTTGNQNGVASATSDGLTLQVYPNPTQSSAVVSFTLPASGRARIVIYNTAGREVATLIDGEFSAGSHQATLDGRGLTPGVYYVDYESNGGRRVTHALTILP